MQFFGNRAASWILSTTLAGLALLAHPGDGSSGAPAQTTAATGPRVSLAPPTKQVSAAAATQPTKAQIAESARRLFARENLVAWCIVPFDSKNRSPQDRAAMLEQLGFKRFAYDWRAEHIPSFDAEMDSLAQKGIKLEAFWVAPGELNRESRIILDLLKRHGLKTRLWVLLDLGPTA